MAPSPVGPATLDMLVVRGGGGFLLSCKIKTWRKKKINPPNIPASWRAWCDVVLEMGTQNWAPMRPWGAQETNLPKPALWGLACANMWSPALIWGPQY